MASSFEFPSPVGVFTWEAASLTLAAQAALAVLQGVPAPELLRGEADDFAVFFRFTETSFAIAGLTRERTTLTVRVEDVWSRLSPAQRAYCYRCAVVRDVHAKDAAEQQAAGVVQETLDDLAPDVRICLDLAAHGGFVLTFTPQL